MQGVLLVSADPAVRASLRVILQEGRTIHERATVGEAIALAAGRRMDLVFVDDVFLDGTAADLVRELNRLGYGYQIVPLLLALDPPCTAPFRPYGVRYFVPKPFQVDRIREIAEVIESPPAASVNAGTRLTALWEEERNSIAAKPSFDFSSAAGGGQLSLGVREVAQRLQRLLSRSLKRADLFHTFAEALEEQFDVDNVVILLPAEDVPEFRILHCNVVDEVREQFAIPFGQPLLAVLTRLGEPLDLYEDRGSNRGDPTGTARLYGERMGIQLLCPVLSRGRLLALVGLSRSHRYDMGATFRDLLRFFLSLFARALDHAIEHEQISAEEARFRMIVDALPAGAVLVSPEGICKEINPAAAALLEIEQEEFLGLPVEKLDSRLAGLVRDALETGRHPAPRILVLPGGPVEVSLATAYGRTAPDGVVVMLNHCTEDRTSPGRIGTPPTNFWTRLADSLAHNFKNALVPVKTCADLLPERFQDEGFRNSFFKVTRDGLERVNVWIEQLGLFGKVDAATQRQTVFPLHEAVENGLEKAVAEFPQMSVDVSRKYDGKDRVRAARDVIEQVFVEVLRNALSAMKDCPEPRLRLCTQVFAAAVQATIVDAGPGIDPKDAESVFEPFHSGCVSGLGLGLSFVQSAVALHKGKVKLIPAIGAGACVQIVLPANLGDASPGHSD